MNYDRVIAAVWCVLSIGWWSVIWSWQKDWWESHDINSIRCMSKSCRSKCDWSITYLWITEGVYVVIQNWGVWSLSFCLFIFLFLFFFFVIFFFLVFGFVFFFFVFFFCVFWLKMCLISVKHYLLYIYLLSCRFLYLWVLVHESQCLIKE
jgi:hypothetical protein